MKNWTPNFDSGALFDTEQLATHPGLALAILSRTEQIDYLAMLAAVHADRGQNVVLISPAEDLLAEIIPALRRTAAKVAAVNDRVHVIAERRLSSRGRTARTQVIEALDDLDQAIDALGFYAPPVVLLPLAHLIDDTLVEQVVAHLLAGTETGQSAARRPRFASTYYPDIPTGGFATLRELSPDAEAANRPLPLDCRAARRVVMTREPLDGPAGIIKQADLVLSSVFGFSAAARNLIARKSREGVRGDHGWINPR